MRVFPRVLLIVLLIGLIGAVGYGVWDAGYQQGLTETVESTTDVIVTAPYYPGFWGVGLVFKLFFVFLLFGLLFKFAFGWRRWGGHHMGDGPGGHRARMEGRLTEWHDAAHREAPPADPAGPVS
jgi:hypothetical protein